MTDEHAGWIKDLVGPLRVKPGSRVDLARDFDPGARFGVRKKQDGQDLLRQGVKLLAEYQDRLAAQDTYGVLVVLQALDAGGKDSTIRHVMSGMNPQGVRVSSFKEPSSAELRHDYLWRHARELPARGEIGVFNRSHYEEVLVVRVHPDMLARQKLPEVLVTKDIWKERFKDIRDFERHLARNGVAVLKFFLHISREEQRRRLLARLDDPAKRWKFSMGDIADRKLWGRYMDAYEDMISATSRPEAPWHAVPSDHKWFARLVVAGAMIEALEGLNLEYPKIEGAALEELQRVRKALLSEERS
jgi:PPK2 family polyphosphate:nucleotide phosphotransferase